MKPTAVWGPRLHAQNWIAALWMCLIFQV